MAERDLLKVRSEIGMLFQENAIFDSLTVDEHVGYRRLRSFLDELPATLSRGERRPGAPAPGLG